MGNITKTTFSGSTADLPQFTVIFETNFNDSTIVTVSIYLGAPTTTPAETSTFDLLLNRPLGYVEMNKTVITLNGILELNNDRTVTYTGNSNAITTKFDRNIVAISS